MDETGADYTEWSKPERKTPIQHTKFMGSQRVGHDWATELKWTELNWTYIYGI